MAIVKFDDTATSDGNRANDANWFQEDGTTPLERVPQAGDACEQNTASSLGNVTCTSYACNDLNAGGSENTITCSGNFVTGNSTVTVGNVVCDTYLQQLGTTGANGAPVNITGNVQSDVGTIYANVTGNVVSAAAQGDHFSFKGNIVGNGTFSSAQAQEGVPSVSTVEILSITGNLTFTCDGADDGTGPVYASELYAIVSGNVPGTYTADFAIYPNTNNTFRVDISGNIGGTSTIKSGVTVVGGNATGAVSMDVSGLIIARSFAAGEPSRQNSHFEDTAYWDFWPAFAEVQFATAAQVLKGVSNGPITGTYAPGPNSATTSMTFPLS